MQPAPATFVRTAERYPPDTDTAVIGSQKLCRASASDLIDGNSRAGLPRGQLRYQLLARPVSKLEQFVSSSLAQAAGTFAPWNFQLQMPCNIVQTKWSYPMISLSNVPTVCVSFPPFLLSSFPHGTLSRSMLCFVLFRNGLSRGQKTGIEVGVALGALILIAGATASDLLRRRKHTKTTLAESYENHLRAQNHASSNTGWSELSASEQVHEKDGAERVHEKDGEEQIHEMDGAPVATYTTGNTD